MASEISKANTTVQEWIEVLKPTAPAAASAYTATSPIPITGYDWIGLHTEWAWGASTTQVQLVVEVSRDGVHFGPAPVHHTPTAGVAESSPHILKYTKTPWDVFDSGGGGTAFIPELPICVSGFGFARIQFNGDNTTGTVRVLVNKIASI